MKLDIQYLLENLTLEEKTGLCSGSGFWWTKAVARLGVPSIMVSDGPHGLRKQAGEADHIGINGSVEAVCFPSGATLASSFDRALLRQVGEHLGEEARAENLHTVLGPAVNIKRSPLCGRNFEYFSEDPYVAGELAASYINGVQSRQVGTSIKHFAANNQEYHRMSTDTIVSERVLREIYLTAFEKAVKQAKPWSVMCAYNRLNGEYCCENKWLLTDVLRKEWGFDGIVMTDWGAMNRRVDALKAGLNLEMPASKGYNDKKLLKAVEDGTLTIEELNHSVEELLKWIEKGLQDAESVPYDKEEHHNFSSQCAAESAVLLKNEGELLPLPPSAKVAFIGDFAKSPRFQGGGSSHINSYKTTSAVEAVKDRVNVSYAAGWSHHGEEHDNELFEEAVQLAQTVDTVVIFAGLPDSFESEGYDRTHLHLPKNQNELIEAVCAVQSNVVVLLHNGSPVAMPWKDKVSSILEMYLGGQAVGQATVDLLFGKLSPSGHLAETFPLHLEDTPCYLNFPGYNHQVEYAEGVYVGYRWYESRHMPVLFPFGHGLTYTKFALENMQLSKTQFNSNDTITVSVDLTNVGERAGAQAVQLYVMPPENLLGFKPAKELQGFEKIKLQPGETQKVSFTLDKRSFSYYDESIQDWNQLAGDYTVALGFSVEELLLKETVTILAQEKKFEWNEWTTIGDLIQSGFQDEMQESFRSMGEAFGIDSNEEEENEDAMISKAAILAMLDGFPIHSLASFADVPVDFEEQLKKKIVEKSK
ncbi:glycoside hydrolase family 3 C-terminal domain-containing protein [Scatolibacter rhodanostii]|uniref:glycoside hydrolase family 3 C-terminal domain-containing protein n=1 Tax=Scatolibacter rhodanostii TaxID=2014781 RepID=UPI000C086981|nr:glycoside hydrolase family 3 C-terminal domain-containing protein [Scatolibacter rhodanostii]